MKGCRIGLEAEFWFLDPTNRHPDTEDVASWGSRRLVAKLLEEDLGVRIVAPRELKRKQWRTWKVMPEHSLDPFCIPRRVLCGVEVVSPPLSFGEFAEYLRVICEFVRMIGHTDLNCGVHFNISVPGIKHLDSVKLGLLTPDITLLRRFNRGHHPKILSFQHELAMRASKDPAYLAANNSEAVLEVLRKLLPVGKETSLNVEPWWEGRGYVEFRQCGGAGWEHRYEALLRAATLCAESLEAACDPKARRRSVLARQRQLRNEAMRLKRGEVTQYALLRQREPDWVRLLTRKPDSAFTTKNEVESSGNGISYGS